MIGRRVGLSYPAFLIILLALSVTEGCHTDGPTDPFAGSEPVISGFNGLDTLTLPSPRNTSYSVPPFPLNAYDSIRVSITYEFRGRFTPASPPSTPFFRVMGEGRHGSVGIFGDTISGGRRYMSRIVKNFVPLKPDSAVFTLNVSYAYIRFSNFSIVGWRRQ